MDNTSPILNDNMETATIRPGALSFVLQTARIAGLAPLSFKKLPNGYSISISRFQLAYSFLVVTVLNVIGLIGVYLNLNDKKIVHIKSNSMTLIMVSDRITCILICGIGYMGAIRMKNMICHINVLQKIRNKINYGYNSAKEYKTVMWIYYFIIIATVTLTLLEIMYTLSTSISESGIILFAVHHVEYVFLILLKIQIVGINFEVYTVILELNARLRFILTLADSDHSRNANSVVIKNAVRSFTKCYLSICEVVGKINNNDGLYMFLVYTSFILFSVLDGYALILSLNRANLYYGWAGITIRCGWCIMIIISIFFFVEPFQRISEKVAEMKVLLTQLTCRTPLGNQVSLELDIMIKQVILNEPQYSAPGINTLKRSLISLTLHGIITFIVFVVQLQ